MISQLRTLLGSWDSRVRLLTFGVMGLVAFLIGFVLVPPATIERLITHGGYYYILGVFAAFVVYALRVAQPRWSGLLAGLRNAGWMGVTVIAGTLFALWSDSFAHKVLFDEYVLQGTAWHMHATKEVATPMRAYDFAGTWLAIDTFLDKRPYFFTFLLSLLHDLTGFRLQNVYILNGALTGVTLGAVAWLVHALTRRVAAVMLSVALLATLPVFGQNATGASMELHNLAMIAVVMVCAVVYLRAPDPNRLALLIFGAVLLAQCRYESVIFVLPVAWIIVVGWLKAKQLLLPWPALIAPLLLVPYAWHDRFVGSKPILWQLREGESARFGWQYLAGNLEGARSFFFSITSVQPSSLGLSVLGLGALVWVLVRFIQRWRLRPSAGALSPSILVTAAFGLTIAANLGILMFYYWSRLDDFVTARFALPFYMTLAVLVGWTAHSLERCCWPGVRLASAVLVAWMLVIGAPAYARRLYTQHNLVMHEIEWELQQASSRPRPPLVITNKATMPFLLNRIPAVNTAAARGRGAQIMWHLEQGTFPDVMVMQVLRPTSAAGDVGVDPDDVLPDTFRLEPLARKRFGARWIQISRLLAIDEASPVTSPAQ
jgi:hypothetical protein